MNDIEKKVAHSRWASVLAIGGLDPTGGAGLLLDMHAIRAAGLHGAGVVATITIQTGREFKGSYPQDAHRVRAGIDAVLTSTEVGAVKTGALGSRENVVLLAELAKQKKLPHLVVDPVIQSTTRGALFDADALLVFARELLPRASLLTPNLAEASLLTDINIKTTLEMPKAARALIKMGARAVLLKGGHLDGDRAIDLLLDRSDRPVWLESPKHPVDEVRGTGCALASAIATLLARGFHLESAIRQAKELVGQAIKRAKSVGPGPRILDFTAFPSETRGG